jgi:nitrile hydratase
VHDVGGQTGFGPVPASQDGSDQADSTDGAPFRADWEARVFALSRVMTRRGVFSSDEFRDAIERLPPERYLAASYYERWLEAMENLLARKGVA